MRACGRLARKKAPTESQRQRRLVVKQVTNKPAAAEAPKKSAAASAVVNKIKKKTRGVNVEASVSHVLARTGLKKESGYPGSKASLYKTDKEIPKATKLAEVWLKTMPLP